MCKIGSFRAVTALLTTLAVTSVVHAQTWTGNFDTSWNHGFNWSGSIVPNSATAAVVFGTAGAGAVNIDTSVQALSISFTNTVGNYTLTSSSGQTLSGLTNITVGSGVTTTQTINLDNNPYGNLLFPSDSSLAIVNNATVAGATLVIGPGTVFGTPGAGGVITSGTGTTIISGTFAEPGNGLNIGGGVTANGPGILELTGNNAYLGGSADSGYSSVSLNGGTLAINADAALGYSTLGLQLNANSTTTGGLEFLNSGVNIARPVTVSTATRVISNGTDSNTISGLISGVGQLVKDGAGTLNLTNTGNSYSGGTMITAGVLAVANAAALGSGTVTMNGGELRATATTAVSNTLIVNQGTTATFSAVPGATLSLAGTFLINAPGSLSFGSAGNTGTVYFAPNGGVISANGTINVNYGTLTGNANLVYLPNEYPTIVAAGATLDLNDIGGVAFLDLAGAGTVHTGTVSTTVVTLNMANYSGIITGAGQLATTPNSASVILSGANSYTGGTTLNGGTTGLGNDAALGTGPVTVTGASVIYAAGASHTLANAVTIDAGQTLSVGQDPNGPYTLTISGPLTGPGTLVKTGADTLILTGTPSLGGYQVNGGSLDFRGAFVQANFATLAAAAGATIQYDGGTTVNGGFLRGPGTHVVTGGSTLNGSTTYNSTVVSVTGPASFVNFSNGGPMNISAALPAQVIFNGFTNQGSGTITIGAGSQVNAADFQSYGTVTLTPATGNNFTELMNSGTSPLYFNGGSQTFIGTATAPNPNVVGVDLAGQNLMLNGGLFVNNGVVFSGVNGGSIIVGYGATYKGAGTTDVPIVTQNGGKVTFGNCPGVATFGSLVIGSGGISNLEWEINDAGPSATYPHAPGVAGPNSAPTVSGWSLGQVTSQSSRNGAQTYGNLTWTATPANKFDLDLETLVGPATQVGTTPDGLMADFDPTQSYTWPIITYQGTYSGPTNNVQLTADTFFDPSLFANALPAGATFGLHLDQYQTSGGELDLIYTPSAVPEPGTMALSGLAAIGWVTFWRRRWRSELSAA